MDNTVTPPSAPLPPPPDVPKMVNIAPQQSIFSRMGSFFSSRNGLFFLGGLVVLLLGLGVGTVLVQRQQDIRSKATGGTCSNDVYPYPINPTHQQTGVSTTPTFQWKYFEPDKPDLQECTDQTGFHASIYVSSCATKGQDGFRTVDPKSGPACKLGQKIDDNSYPVIPDDCTLLIFCSTGKRDGQPWTEIKPESCFWYKSGSTTDVDYSKPLSTNPLSSGSEYWWSVTPGHGDSVHACNGEAWRFTTSSTSASCQMVSADKDLTNVKIGDTVKFTGYGSVSSDTDKIDKITFILTKDGTPGPDNPIDAVAAHDKDSGSSKFYVATQSAQITTVGSYSMRIKVHWLHSDGTGEWKE